MSCDECSFPHSLCQCSADEEREARKVLAYAARVADKLARDHVEQEVADLFPETCNAATHVPRNSLCTCEDSRDE